ncbi:hypothetical protein NHX12_030257 [Muraenolepis orangiensis]|uniref:Transmembrane protein 51 n=1 Tax=Muraenolepis orangiensis TaxID=630683 RepID=A0A9Q0ILP4_9TELE|nr:hypothetical protein NHX12_030257 [Muraenolepis orangiensis]
MCSSRGLCRDGDRSSRSESSGSCSHYALIALGFGLVAVGVVIIVYKVTLEAKTSESSAPNTTDTHDHDQDKEDPEMEKIVPIAFVLVGGGIAMLLLAICLRMKAKNEPAESGGQRVAAPNQDQVAGESSPEESALAYDVPSYNEVVGGDAYPVRHTNLRDSIAHLPSYEDILAAVENEGAAGPHAETESPKDKDDSDDDAGGGAAAATAPLTGPEEGATGPGSAAAANANPPARSGSRVSRLLRPLRVRRMMSDKLHLKDFRIHIRSPTHNPVTIEPITPPPQYDDKAPDLA